MQKEAQAKYDSLLAKKKADEEAALAAQQQASAKPAGAPAAKASAAGHGEALPKTADGAPWGVVLAGMAAAAGAAEVARRKVRE